MSLREIYSRKVIPVNRVQSLPIQEIHLQPLKVMSFREIYLLKVISLLTAQRLPIRKIRPLTLELSPLLLLLVFVR
jgi:hypothetical protein